MHRGLIERAWLLAGQEIRIVDIPVNRGREGKGFSRIHSHSTTLFMVEYWYSTPRSSVQRVQKLMPSLIDRPRFGYRFITILNFKARVRKKVLPHLEAGGAVLECQHCGCGFVRLLLSLSAWVGKD